jgi:hypothetical protein
MNSEQVRLIRKRPMTALTAGAATPEPGQRVALDLAARATIYYSSEDPEHPIEHMLDGTTGRGASRWTSARPDATEQIVFEFDEPQDISVIAFEVEETERERTQEVRAEYSCDGGRTYRHAFVQEYTFSPNGATYQCESLSVELRGVTRLRFTVVPNKGGAGKARITSLRVYS